MNPPVVVLGVAIVIFQACTPWPVGAASSENDNELGPNGYPDLKVTEPEEREYKADNGTNVTITCTGVNFLNYYRVDWSVKTRNGRMFITSAAEQIPNNKGKYLVSQNGDDDEFYLTITSITQRDSGLYICSTFYNSHSIEGTVKVIVEGIPHVDVFAHNMSAPIGGKAKLSCEFTAIPHVKEIVWMKDDDVIENGTDNRFFIMNYGSMNVLTILNIHNVSEHENSTNFTCEATNDKGSAREYVFLTTYEANASYVEIDRTKYAKIVEPVSDHSYVNIDETLRITCAVGGFPYQPKLWWIIQSESSHPPLHIKDTDEIRCNDVIIRTYVMQKEAGFYYTLVTGPVMYNNTGRYLCEVPFHDGIVRDHVDITVKGRPVVIANDLSIVGVLGQQVALTCVVYANPAPMLVLWYHEDTPIPTTLKSSQSTVKVNSIEMLANLTIYSLEEVDFGTYTCKAYNSIAHGMAVQVIQDVDECSFNHKCEHGCVNVKGSYRCDCNDGYTLAEDGRSCKDVNECQLEKVVCEQHCTNSNGSFQCSCRSGFTLDENGKMCTDDVDDDDDSSEGDEEEIQTELVYSIIGATSGALLIIILLILCIVWCRRKKDEEQMPMKAVYSVNTAYSETSSELKMTKYHSTSDKDTAITPVDEFPRQRLQLGIDLGEGRFGKVMMARALNISGTGRWEMVAVKTCRDCAPDCEKEDIYQELETMRRVTKHPNIVSYLGCCTQQDPIYILMEYVPGGNLQCQLRKCRPSQMASTTEEVTPPTIKELETHAFHVAKGMVHLSSIGVIHRDLAARNILVGRDRVCKICDLGLARDVEGSDMYERTSKGPAPIRWMAPESLSDQCFTRKSDVWSFGVLLWEIVTLGATPYPGMTAREVIQTVLMGKWLQCPLHCKQELYNLMTRCWDMEPKERPGFNEILKEIEILIECETDNSELGTLQESVYGVLDSNKVDERV